MNSFFVASLLQFLLLVLVQAATERDIQYFEALKKIDFNAVKEDLERVLTENNEDYPADYGNYGPNFIRLAWHCAGTYREFDGEGGCSGARIRFDPERSWDDNTNLEKARKLLEPIKLKYGTGLSWGDLITLSGTVAIQSMGGPYIGFCAGRSDESSGANSANFSPIERELIYINPGGLNGVPDPANSVAPTRNAFRTMGMNDEETVALIGGGHAFGKTHGACPLGAGPGPDEQPADPWPGLCGAGVGNRFTSGFEGPWTTTPTQWSNHFFTALMDAEFVLGESPAGNSQFFVDSANPPQAPHPDPSSSETQQVMFLVTDLALTRDDSFRSIVEDFAENPSSLDRAFGEAWYKLMSRDMGPRSRCFGDDVPSARQFQSPLPVNNEQDLPADSEVFRVGRSLLDKEIANFQQDLDENQKPYNGPMIIEAAYLCASTFRNTDFQGGCNGARILLEPERSWADRAPLSGLLDFLIDFKDEIRGDRTYTKSDFLVFAGTEALQVAAGSAEDFPFCPFRSDAETAPSSDFLRVDFDDKLVENRKQRDLLGLSTLEFAALQARPRSPVYMQKLGYTGSYTRDLKTLSNEFMKVLLSNKWTEVPGTEDLIKGREYRSAAGHVITEKDFALLIDDEFQAALQELASDNQLFLDTFQTAWTKLMNNDRFDGPVENECENGKVGKIQMGALLSETKSTPGAIFLLLFIPIGLAGLYLMYDARHPEN